MYFALKECLKPLKMKTLEPSSSSSEIPTNGRQRRLHQKVEVLENKVALEEIPTWLTTVVRVSRYLLEQGLGFRSHDQTEEDLVHRGHFLELIGWVCDYDVNSCEVMSNAPQLSLLALFNLQRDIIKCCGAETRKEILSEMGDKYFSLLLEEPRDGSLKRKIAVVLRFVNDNGEIVKRFLGVVHVVEYSGQGLKDVLDKFLVKNELSLSRLRGSSVGWAPNMREEIKELITLIRNENKNVHYIHSFANELQSIVVSVAEENRHFGLFFDYISMIVNMVTCPRLKHDDDSGKEYCEELVVKIFTGVSSTLSCKNKNISWGSHFETLLALFDSWEVVEEVLIFITLMGDCRKDRGKAKDLIERMGTFEFVFLGKLMLFILRFVDRASKLLQDRDQDIEIALNEVHKLLEVLVIYTKEGWDQLFEGVKAFCEEHKIEVPNMEDPVKSRCDTLFGGNPPYFRRFRFEIMDQVCRDIFEEVINRVNDESADLLKCVNCLHPSNSFALYNHDKLVHLSELYPEDFSRVERAELYHQLDVYIDEMRGNPKFSDIPDLKTLVKKLVENNIHVYFPLVYRLIELASVLTFASPVVGRKFSAVNIAEIDLHDRFGFEALSDRLLCYIEKNICAGVDEEAILQRFKQVASSNNVYQNILF